MTAVKLFQTYDEQVDLLKARGMDVGDREIAIAQLKHVSYYRLSGYWYPFRRIEDGKRTDEFFPDTTLKDVMKLYSFDATLRSATFGALAPIELTMRALLGHTLGRVHECAHLERDVLNARAQGQSYDLWLSRYVRESHDSHEEFVKHHRRKYEGRLPVWAAVEILDWGGLTKLFGFSPREVQDEVAAEFGLRAPQLESWLKSLDIVRNVSAHHGRLFNRVFALAPRLPPAGKFPALDSASPFTRTFGHLSLIQFMLDSQGLRRQILPAVMRTFPDVRAVPISHLGASPNWSDSPLWS